MLEANKRDLRKFYKNDKPFFLLIACDDCDNWMLIKDGIEVIEDDYNINFLFFKVDDDNYAEEDASEIIRYWGLEDGNKLPCAVFYDGSSFFVKQNYLTVPEVKDLVSGFYIHEESTMDQ